MGISTYYEPAAPAVDYGRRLVPVLIDQIAKDDPSRTFISYARGATADEGYVDIDYKAFARAVNRCAWYLEEQIGRSQTDTTVFYIGPLDIRYIIIWIAALKTGHVAFFSSHRNSLKAHLSLLEKTECNICLEPEKAPSALAQILAERPMTRVPFADLDSWLDDKDAEGTKEYPFRGTYDQVKDQTSIILHTSGSTGIPKPVYVPHGVYGTQDAHQLIPSAGGKPTWVDLVRGRRVFIGLPLFHAACLTQVGVSVFVKNYVVVLPPAGPMNVDVVDGVFTHGNAYGALIAPSLIVDVYKRPEVLANMVERIKFLAYVGGTVSKAIGDELCSKLHLITNFGSTETFSPPLEVLDDRKDWEYLSYSPLYGHEMRPVGNGLCELIIVRKPELHLYQGVFSTFPKLKEYSTSDLYEQHPTNETLWRFRMRSDDIICFNNAEKLNPITMEATITGHPAVQSAVIGGHGQFQSCLLLEPKVFPRTAGEATRLLDDVWPTVKAANNDCPAHGRLMRNFIMLSDPERPLPRAGKDTVQRAAVFNLYERDFHAIYNVPEGENPLLIATGGKLAGGEPLSPAKPVTQVKSIANNIANGLINGDSTDETLINGHHGPGKPADVGLTNGHSTNGHLTNGHLPANEIPSVPISDIEAYVERYLERRLPEMFQEQLNKSLGLVMSQMASNLLGGTTPLAPATNGFVGVSTNGVKSHEEVVDAVPTLDAQDIQSFKAVLRHVVLDTTYVTGLTDEVNMFDCGLDSVQVPELRKAINKALSEHLVKTGPVAAKTIYDNPSINALAQALYDHVN